MEKTRVELLQRVPLFQGLQPRDLEGLARSMKARTFRAGETVAAEGESGVGFFVIEDGEARVTVGNREVARLGHGDYFGEIALIAEIDRTATIVAETELRCHGMTSWEFRPFVETNAQIAWKLLEALARKLREAEKRDD